MSHHLFYRKDICINRTDHCWKRGMEISWKRISLFSQRVLLLAGWYIFQSFLIYLIETYPDKFLWQKLSRLGIKYVICVVSFRGKQVRAFWMEGRSSPSWMCLIIAHCYNLQLENKLLNYFDKYIFFPFSSSPNCSLSCCITTWNA